MVNYESSTPFRLLMVGSNPLARSMINAAVGDIISMSQVSDSLAAVRMITEAHELGEPFDVLLLDVELSTQDDVNVVRFLRALEEPRTLVGGKSPKLFFLSNSDQPYRSKGDDVEMGRSSVQQIVEEIRNAAHAVKISVDAIQRLKA